MSVKCINYIFCKGIAFPGMGEDTCLLCGEWYAHGEGWGKLEFIETNDECAVCYKKGLQVKFPTKCGHSFCIRCSINLLYWEEDHFNICPISYGCPPCKHYMKDTIRSCKKRPCCDEDQEVLDMWEAIDYDNFIKWNNDEFNYINTDYDYLTTKKCPICRSFYVRK